MVTGSGLNKSSLPQNLGIGRRNAPIATSWGRGDAHLIVEETIGKVACQSGGSLLSNENRTLAHIAFSHDGLAFGADTKRNERSHVPLRCAAVQRGGLSELSAVAVEIHGSQAICGSSPTACCVIVSRREPGP